MKNFYLLFIFLITSCFLHAADFKMSVYFEDANSGKAVHALPLKKNGAEVKIVFFYNDREMAKNEVLIIKYYKTGDGNKWLLKDKKAFKVNQATMIGKQTHQYTEPGVYLIAFENEKGEVLGEDGIVIYAKDGFQKQIEQEDLECYFSYSIDSSERANSENISFASNSKKEGRVFLKRPKGKFDGTFRWRIYKRDDGKWTRIEAKKGERNMVNPLSVPIIFSHGSGGYLLEIYNVENTMLGFIYLNVSITP